MDISLIPSRFEPAGLSAMYNLKYGALPVARATGGIQEIIEDYDPTHGQRLRLSLLRIFKRSLLGRDQASAANLSRPESLDQADETGDGTQFFLGRIRAAATKPCIENLLERPRKQQPSWRGRRAPIKLSACQTDSSVEVWPAFSPQTLWLTQLLKRVADSFASRKAIRSMSIFSMSIPARPRPSATC